MSKSLYINVRPRGNLFSPPPLSSHILIPPHAGKPIKNLPEETYVKPDDNAHDLYLRIAAKSRFPINRLRITKASDGAAVPNARDVTVEEIGLFDQSSLFVKDLGKLPRL